MTRKNCLHFIVIIILLIISPVATKANHAAGGEIIYEHMQDSTYRILFKFYRDCSGPAAPANLNLCMTESCFSTTSTIQLDIWPGTGSPISAGCSQYPTRCQSATSTLPGYEEHWYYKVVELPYQCNSWKFFTYIGNRNTSFNIAGSSGLFFYIETTFNNSNGFQGNSSPYFSIKPIPYVCINQPYSYNNGAIDINRDSLVTEIIQPLTGVTSCQGTPVATSWATPATPAYNLINNPIQTNNTFTLNSATGQMNFTPSATGPYILTVKTSEYRKGQLIGYIMRDVQIQVLGCNTVSPTLDIDQNSITGGGWLSRVNGCIDQELNFCFNIKSSDTENVYVIEDNHAAVLPGSIITYTNQKNDSVRGCVKWTPTSADAGLKTLIITAKDSTCKPPGIMIYYSFTLPIYIWPPVKTVPDTSICPGETAYLNATGGGNYLWSVLPGGDPITSLSNPNIANPIASPYTSTTYVVTSTINSFCNNNKDTVKVGVLPGLNFTNIADTITCPDNAIVLNLKVNPPAGSVYKVKWTPSTYLDDDTLSAPTVKAKTSTTYTVILTSSGSLCKGYDTVLVDILKGFKLNTRDTAICDGKNIQVDIAGDPRYTYEWKSDGNPGVFSNPNIIDPIITPSPIGKNRYFITAKYHNCLRDSAADFTIDMQPYPVVNAGLDNELCFGDTTKLRATVSPTNYPFLLNWTPGASLSKADITDPIFKATETTSLILTATTTAGCSANDTVKMIVFPAHFIFAEGDTAICPGNRTTLHLKGNGVKSIRWYPENNISDKYSYNPVVYPTATQTYAVYGIDTNNCRDTQQVKVIVHPKATLYLPDSILLYPGQHQQINPEGNCSYFNWFPSLGLSKDDVSNPVVKPDVNTKYIVNATTESGCSVKDSVNVILIPESIVNMPNAFRPGSGTNNTFKVLHLGDAVLKNFSIYNRWGVKVFETTDINNGWDGTYKGQPQPLGVYVYVVDVVTNTGKPVHKQGNLTLLR